jgi:hypothetical protein
MLCGHQLHRAKSMMKEIREITDTGNRRENEESFDLKLFICIISNLDNSYKKNFGQIW